MLLPASSRVWDGDMVAAALGSLVPDRSLVYRVSRAFEGSDAVSKAEPVYGTPRTRALTRGMLNEACRHCSASTSANTSNNIVWHCAALHAGG